MSRQTTIPTADAIVVVVGGPPALIEATRRAAGIVAAARVETAELGTAATLLATHRPFAVVISEDVFAFDAGEFRALARDVNASLILVDTGNPDQARLERTLMPQLGAALRKRRG